MARPTIVSVAPLLLLLAFPAVAQNGQIPIPFAAPVVTPIVITAPGSYVVTRNLLPTGPGPIIDIAVGASPGGDVQIDLNGMVLDNSANPNDPVIRVTALGSSEVTLRDGTLVGGSTGIEAFGPTRKLVVEDVKISDFTASAHFAGIHTFDVLNTVIRRCVIIDAVGPGNGAGIYLHGGIPRQATIEDNLIQNTFDGIIATPLVRGLKISNNRLLNILPNGPYGAAISLDDTDSCIVSQNTIHDVNGLPPQGVGILLNVSWGCKVDSNTVVRPGGNGIELTNGADGNLVLNNVVWGAGGDGIFVNANGNHIDRNVMTVNGGYGLHLGTTGVENTMGRNTATGNNGGGPCAFPWSPDLCDDAGPPAGGPNYSFGNNLMPGSFGPI